jgi:hypothetical protein
MMMRFFKTQIQQGEHLPASVAPAIVYATRTPCAQRLSFGGGHGDWIAAGSVTCYCTVHVLLNYSRLISWLWVFTKHSNICHSMSAKIIDMSGNHVRHFIQHLN